MKKGLMAAFIAVLAVVLIAVFVMMSNKKDDNATSSTTNTTDKSQSTKTGSDDGTQTDTGQTGPVETDKISIKNVSFEFDEVKVKKGTTVIWTNLDDISHTVTGDDGTTPKSGTLKPGDTYAFTFNEVGSFSYHCSFHPSMTGKVTVTE